MRNMEILKPELTGKKKNHLETAEMKDNIIQKAKAILNRNRELALKVLKTNWNKNLKDETLKELKACRSETKKIAEGFVVLGAMENTVPDDYYLNKTA